MSPCPCWASHHASRSPTSIGVTHACRKDESCGLRNQRAPEREAGKAPGKPWVLLHPHPLLPLLNYLLPAKPQTQVRALQHLEGKGQFLQRDQQSLTPFLHQGLPYLLFVSPPTLIRGKVCFPHGASWDQHPLQGKGQETLKRSSPLTILLRCEYSLSAPRYTK